MREKSISRSSKLRRWTSSLLMRRATRFCSTTWRRCIRRSASSSKPCVRMSAPAWWIYSRRWVKVSADWSFRLLVPARPCCCRMWRTQSPPTIRKLCWWCCWLMNARKKSLICSARSKAKWFRQPSMSRQRVTCKLPKWWSKKPSAWSNTSAT